MQFKLALHVFRLIQSKKLSEADFLQMPYTTVDRIDWLARRQLIQASSEEMAQFQKAYVASLVWFGLSQKKFEVQSSAEIFFPKKDLRDVADAISLFCSRTAA